NSFKGSIRSNLANSNKEKYYLSEEDDLNARLASLIRKVEAMELKKVKKIKFVQEKEVCSNCELLGHSINKYPNIPVQANFMNTLKNLSILHILKLTIHNGEIIPISVDKMITVPNHYIHKNYQTF
ncbi:hypothetical protein Pfo_021693, partial [Paulownia fortunei]